jgi:hypothetical protein
MTDAGVPYPKDQVLGYDELEALVLAALPIDRSFFWAILSPDPSPFGSPRGRLRVSWPSYCAEPSRKIPFPGFGGRGPWPRTCR